MTGVEDAWKIAKAVEKVNLVQLIHSLSTEGRIPANKTRHKQVFFDGIMTYFGPLKNDETY